MTSLLALIFLICAASHLPAQNNTRKTDSVSNQGDIEKQWTEKLFEEKYFLQQHIRYSCFIFQTDSNYFHFGQKVFRIPDSDLGLYTLCKLGILYPDVIPGGITDTTILTYFEEIKYFSLKTTIRRFHFNLNLARLSNPIVYFIESTNENATAANSQADFIKDSKLTFISQGWLMY